MDRTQMVELIKTLLEKELTEEARIQTFGERGILTSNEGLYVRFTNGVEFQITVVQKQFGDKNKLNIKILRSSKTKKRKVDNPHSSGERCVLL